MYVCLDIRFLLCARGVYVLAIYIYIYIYIHYTAVYLVYQQIQRIFVYTYMYIYILFGCQRKVGERRDAYLNQPLYHIIRIMFDARYRWGNCYDYGGRTAAAEYRSRTKAGGITAVASAGFCSPAVLHRNQCPNRRCQVRATRYSICNELMYLKKLINK